jgi:large subunit ribosomal protein L9
MDIILLERIDKLGQMGDVVTVKTGYARNFLLPKKKALRATDANKIYFESKRTELEAINLERRTEAEAVAKKMEGLHLVLIRQAGEGGQLYGSVTARDVADSLRDENVTMERGQVDLHAAIKQLGQYSVPVKLHPEVSIGITVTVSRSKDQADIDAAAAIAAALMEKSEDAKQAVQLEQEAEHALEATLEAESKDAEPDPGTSTEPSAEDSAEDSGESEEGQKTG